MGDETTNSNGMLNISEAAELLGIPQSTLRYYEDVGLIKPARTSSSGYRLYSPLTLIELTDVIIYRHLGVPVKKIVEIMHAPASEAAQVCDETLTKTAEELHQLSKKIEELASYSQRLRRLFSAKSIGPYFVKRPEITHLYSFNISNPSEMQAYVTSPTKVKYSIHFANADESTVYEDCMLDSLSPGMIPLWMYNKRRDGESFLECLLKTEYLFTENNNMDELAAFIREQGMVPGYAIGRYLTFDYDPADGKKYDYYLMWIQARPQP